jgi:ribosomal protein L32
LVDLVCSAETSRFALAVRCRARLTAQLTHAKHRKHRRNIFQWLDKIESFAVCKGCGEKHLPHVLCAFCFPFNNYMRHKDTPKPDRRLLDEKRATSLAKARMSFQHRTSNELAPPSSVSSAPLGSGDVGKDNKPR